MTPAWCRFQYRLGIGSRVMALTSSPWAGVWRHRQLSTQELHIIAVGTINSQAEWDIGSLRPEKSTGPSLPLSPQEEAERDPKGSVSGLRPAELTRARTRVGCAPTERFAAVFTQSGRSGGLPAPAYLAAPIPSSKSESSTHCVCRHHAKGYSRHKCLSLLRF